MLNEENVLQLLSKSLRRNRDYYYTKIDNSKIYTYKKHIISFNEDMKISGLRNLIELIIYNSQSLLINGIEKKQNFISISIFYKGKEKDKELEELNYFLVEVNQGNKYELYKLALYEPEFINKYPKKFITNYDILNVEVFDDILEKIISDVKALNLLK